MPFLQYLTQNEIVLGAGYPVETTLRSDGVGISERVQTLVLFFAHGAENNPLCASAQRQQQQQRQTGRRRRDVPGQEELANLFRNVEL